MLSEIDLEKNQYIHVILPVKSANVASDTNTTVSSESSSTNLRSNQIQRDPHQMNFQNLDQLNEVIDRIQRERELNLNDPLRDRNINEIIDEVIDNEAPPPNRLPSLPRQDNPRIQRMPRLFNPFGVGAQIRGRRSRTRRSVFRRIFLRDLSQGSEDPANDEEIDARAREGSPFELFIGMLLGFILGPWSFFCMISSKISRKLRTGIVMGFMGWILVKMNDANLKI